jgi:hypothetical protein
MSERDPDRNLTPEQADALEAVRGYVAALRDVKAKAVVDARELVEERTRPYVAARDQTARLAVEAGVSLAALKRALGTKDHATVKRIIEGGGK